MPSDLRTRFKESKHRYLFQVGAVYAIGAWAVIQVATSTFPYLGLPAWIVTAVIIAAVAGFPIVLVFAWLSERGRLRARWIAAVSVAAVLASFALLLPRFASLRASADASGFAGATLSQLTFSQEVEQFPAFSPDGKLLVFSREVNGFRQLFLRTIASGDEQQLTKDSVDHIQAAFSADGAAILYVQARVQRPVLEPADVFGAYSAADIWRMTLANRQAQRIIADAFNPSYSPDGKSIAFDASFAGPRRIWIADMLGRNARQITTDLSEAVSHVAPRWSPDGRLIAFQYIEKNRLDIRAVEVSTGKLFKITDDAVRDADPAWLSAGNDLLFSSPRGGGWNLWRIKVRTDGSTAAPQQLTTGAGQDLQSVSSPDGSSVAFVTLNQNSDLWLLPVDSLTGQPTGEPTALITTTREDSRGAWSPDGRFIALNSDRAGDMNLFVYSMAERSTTQLTKGPGGDFQASWSPSAQNIVFFSSRAGNADIWVVDLAGKNLRQLTTDSALDVNPVYSPDGRFIAFQSDRGGRKEVWLMNADGSNQRQLTSSGVGDHFMLWSADGTRVFYHGGGSQVMSIAIAGGAPVLLKEIEGGAHISMSPDASRFMDVVDHKSLWVTPADGATARQVFSFPDKEVRIDYPRWAPNGRFVLFDRLKPTGADIWVLQLRK